MCAIISVRRVVCADSCVSNADSTLKAIYCFQCNAPAANNSLLCHTTLVLIHFSTNSLPHSTAQQLHQLNNMAFKSNFQRSQSKVWWGNYPERDEYGFVALPKNHAGSYSLPKPTTTPAATSTNPSRSAKLTPPEITTTSWSYRRGSPGSFKSHDSGFSDSDQSPRSAASSSSSPTNGQQQSANSSSPNTPKRPAHLKLSANSSSASSSTSGHSTPPTVIRRKSTAIESASSALSDAVNHGLCRRISFSAPSSPIYERIIDDADRHSQIAEDSQQYGTIISATSSTATTAAAAADVSWENSSAEERRERAGRKFPSLRRTKAIRRNNTVQRTDRTMLLRCVSQISIESTDNYYQAAKTLVDEERPPVQPAAGVDGGTDLNDEPPMMMQTAIPQTPRGILKSTRPAYNNETVVFGIGADASSSTSAAADSTMNQTRHVLPTYAELYPAQTSTPKTNNGNHRTDADADDDDDSNNDSMTYGSSKASLSGASTSSSLLPSKAQNSLPSTTTDRADNGGGDTLLELAPTLTWDDCTYAEYTNPLLNGHSSSIQHWLDETRGAYCHEVLATLQTKSIAATALRYDDEPPLNASLAGRLIRQLQHRAVQLQADFEYVERLLADAGHDEALLKELPEQLRILHANVLHSTQHMSVRTIFGVASTSSATSGGGGDVVRFRNNVACIADMSYELVRVADAYNGSATDVEPLGLLEDVQMLKRYVLITVRMVFERLVRIIVDRIEDVAAPVSPTTNNNGSSSSSCASSRMLILRANLVLLAQLSNAAYAGFATLNAAFLATRAIRVLLAICDETQLPSVRVLALRALTTISCTPEAIGQFEACGGTEILVDVLCGSDDDAPQTREALSVFAQITADWHGAEHRLASVRPLVETLVARFTWLAEQTDCCQTLLLAVAALGNLARTEPAAMYSLMSNDSVLRVRAACERCGPGASVFLHVSVLAIV